MLHGLPRVRLAGRRELLRGPRERRQDSRHCQRGAVGPAQRGPGLTRGVWPRSGSGAGVGREEDAEHQSVDRL